MNLPIFEQTRTAVPNAPVSGDAFTTEDLVALAELTADEPIVATRPDDFPASLVAYLSAGILAIVLGGVIFLAAVLA